MTLPHRLLDDPSQAPWLAERLHAAAAPAPLSEDARVQIGHALAARMQAERSARAVPALLCAALALTVLGVVSQLMWNGDEHAPRVIARLRPEPASLRAVVEPKPAIASSAPATHVDDRPQQAPTPTRQTRTGRSPRRHEALGRPPLSPPATATAAPEAEPAWLLEARAALATDPARTLALIRANRDPHVAVTPELLELTVLALEAQRVQREARGVHEP